MICCYILQEFQYGKGTVQTTTDIQYPKQEVKHGDVTRGATASKSSCAVGCF